MPLLTQCWTQSLTRADDLQPKRNVNLTPLLQFFVVVRTKVSKYSPFLPRGELTYPNINGTSDPNFNLFFHLYVSNLTVKFPRRLPFIYVVVVTALDCVSSFVYI